MLQVRNKCSDFLAGDVSQTHTDWLSDEEFDEALYTSNDDSDGVGAFSLGQGTELVTGNEAF